MRRLVAFCLSAILLLAVASGCVRSSSDPAATEARLKRLKEFSVILDYQKALSNNMQSVSGLLSVLQNDISESADTQLWKDNTRAAASRLRSECAKGKALTAPAEYRDQKTLYARSLDRFDEFAGKVIEYLDTNPSDTTRKATVLKQGVDAVLEGGDIIRQATELQDKIETPLLKELDELLKGK